MMQRVDSLLQRWPLHGIRSSRDIEQRARATLPAHTLMRRAGAAVARLALALAPHGERIWIAAGPGNNGGDGLEAAAHLLHAGKSVLVTSTGDPARLPADAAAALQRARNAGVPITAEPPADPTHIDLAIDALLGLGARSDASGLPSTCFEALHRMTCPILAVDLPSGLHADSGQSVGDSVVHATHTLSLLTLKPGLYTGHGRDHAGEVWLDTLAETANTPPDAWLSGGAAMLQALPGRRHVQHKGSFGDVHVVGGARGMLGAVLLAARTALAAGAGRVYVSALDPNAPIVDAARPELMFRADWWHSPPPRIAEGTVLCGCGGGEAVRDVLPPLLAHAQRLVLDADALNAIAADAPLQAQLRARAPRGRATLLTPHPLEAARLLETSTNAVQGDRLLFARELAQRYACGVVLKGSGTVIDGPEGVPQINPTGNSKLASAGTGDVLAGWIAGTWAQAESSSLETALHIACAATFRHGLAAERSRFTALRAADLIEAMVGIDSLRRRPPARPGR